ncbi:hypothetical protein AMD24_00597 [Candidatus Xiphinematobacter sp. Idaho Grape]|uniref:hypothetical protein n=1 Tax=Candidatus Xiphinematobacter sp. Idaho Grape TaxID=1704307 RepID=UPI000706C2E3|nr:hypothetical protein [Candidatus Xiphinematobacter sp. Idaho Grape]ALJ56764.1 hypothetical protein AMD24_00597 [Candidatus Xiphinematobacter sp. Idaho Grape]
MGGLPDGIVVKKINGFWHACTTSDPRGQPEERDSILLIGEDVRAKADLPYRSLAKSKGKLELTPIAVKLSLCRIDVNMTIWEAKLPWGSPHTTNRE